MQSVLVIDDDPDQAEMLVALLTRRDISAHCVLSAEKALAIIEDDEPTVVVSDIRLGKGMSGLQLCAILRERHPQLPVVVITGSGNLDVAIEAIRAGAYDFVTKPIAVDAALAAVHRAFEKRQLSAEVQRLRLEVSASQPIHGILGASPALREIVTLIRRIAGSDATVLVNGESGTGKELISRAVHDMGPRADHPFVAINCAAVPAGLLESELFGHSKGAFTDAKKDRAGLFVQAGKGTIFLDEIGEMPLEMQAKLLRVLQERKVRPVGGEAELAVNARVVCATNRDLEAEVEAGRFREDLFYRVNVVALRVPPLRERGADVVVLANHFVNKIAERSGTPRRTISAAAGRAMLDYDWPGNVRELENCIERAVALSITDTIEVGDLPSKVRTYQSTRIVLGGSDSDNDDLITLAEMERRYVRQVLSAMGGNKSHAAKVLGIDRRSLYRRLEEPVNLAVTDLE